MTAAVFPKGTAWPPHIDGRTGQKVRRNSSPYETGAGFFRPLKKVTVVHIMRGAERLAFRTMRTRAKGRRRGELTLQDLNILEVMLFKFMDWRSGRCEPTYAQIQEVTGHARDTITTAMKRLSKLGILERLRRFRRIEDAEGKGPRVEQAPNAYRFALPRRLQALLGLGAEGPPIPDDLAVAQRDGRISNDIQHTEATGKPTLGAALARLAAAVAERESRK